MNCSYPFNGFGVALVTPFTQDGQVDFDTLTSIVTNQLQSGTDFLCVLGTTAETPVLTQDERIQIVQHVIKIVNGRIPIMVGCSSNCTATAIEQIKLYQLDGIDGILSAVPYYNKPSQEGIYRHFCEISKASQSKPIILYNVPGRTGVNMTAETTLRIARNCPNVIGIKEASGNVEQMKDIIAQAPENFKVIVGDDSLAMQTIKSGAVSVISVIGNAIPKRYGKLIHLTMEGKYDEALKIQQELEPLYGLLFKEGSPCGVKCLMAERGILAEVMRLPLVPVSKELKNEIINKFALITE